jgi:ribosomal protein S18 acetylase RimI-like enzyme
VLIRTQYGHCQYDFELDYTHIYDLFVYPEYRRQGKAKELIQLAINEIRETGYKDVIKIVAKPKENSISLENLIAFYKKMGLEVYTYYG